MKINNKNNIMNKLYHFNCVCLLSIERCWYPLVLCTSNIYYKNVC